MAIRVTQHTMYNNMVGHMQSNLAGYMESVQQGASQKKINRPSDDPAGTYRVLTTRQDMVSTAQYQENVDTAKGWLELADSVLSARLPVAIQGLKTLAEQASTGTYTAEQRMIMADQARQYFGQILNLANTEFEGKSIFSGHKYTNAAFQEGLAVSSFDDNWTKAADSGQLQVAGASASTIIVQFTYETGKPEIGKEMTYRWSDDGGNTWENGTVAEGDDENTLKIEPEGKGVTLTISKGEDGKFPPIAAYDDSIGGPGAKNGTLLYIRPTAVYKGDDNDQPFDINVMGGGSGISPLSEDDITVANDAKGAQIRFDESVIPGKEFSWSYSTDGGENWVTQTAIAPASDEVIELKNAAGSPIVTVKSRNIPKNALITIDESGKPTSSGSGMPSLGSDDMIHASGEIGQNTLIRFDEAPTPGESFKWSYSIDGGTTWVTDLKGSAPDFGDKLRLPIPGGYIDVNMTNIPQDAQILVHPARADLGYEIMKDTYLPVNSVGKDVFGGYYEGKPSLNGSDNLFEVVGKFIGYLEGNNQEGCQKTLEALTVAEKQVLAEATRIGGMENRLSMAADVLSFQKLDQQERLSYVEDIDLTELLTKLTRQQLTYQTVLQSSSMIMQMNLAKYL